MRTLVKQLPNLITLTNLLAGCIGIILVFTGPDITYAAYLILVATILDFLDGASARLVKATSNLGKELDSLADMVSFGVLPGMILFRIIEQTDNSGYLPYLGLLVPLASAIRLAKFNIDTRQAVTFNIRQFCQQVIRELRRH